MGQWGREINRNSDKLHNEKLHYTFHLILLRYSNQENEMSRASEMHG
jgi:hypothetical protein